VLSRAAILGGAMRKAIYFALVVPMLVAVTSVSAEDCGLRPPLPTLPDGASAGPEEMKTGMDVTGDFTIASGEYAACLVALAQQNEDELTRLLKDISSAEKALDGIVDSMRSVEGQRDSLIAEAQTAVEERNVLVKKWNQEAKSFRARLED
jgi:hypothetical protein